ncbi:hypothetical protein Bpfe_019681 [Biomphalaria pfeifferi]|uniref:Uncharacterized protein n=1 Tax=Biomphalaria pfeifferi TaxID=112525 RepID=A0AAD8BCL2_BIOPF|nr:hypothetical protein Bpfe_019681 [Biomphalaria pfeifferi]
MTNIRRRFLNEDDYMREAGNCRRRERGRGKSDLTWKEDQHGRAGAWVGGGEVATHQSLGKKKNFSASRIPPTERPSFLWGAMAKEGGENWRPQVPGNWEVLVDEMCRGVSGMKCEVLRWPAN